MRRTSLDCVYELAKEKSEVVFLGSDLGAGVLEDMRRELPDQWFMEGVSEQHIVGMAAGLAKEGFIPFVNTIATFITRRCFDQIAVDVCLENLPVRLIGNGGGMVYAPLGPTHQAIEDISIMSALPNMTVLAPCDANEMRLLMSQTLQWSGPIYIRLAKGGDELISDANCRSRIGEGVVLKEPGEITFLSTGVMTQRALGAVRELDSRGVSCGLVHFHTLKPFDSKLLCNLVSRCSFVVSVEEHVLHGGLGATVLAALNDARLDRRPPVLRLGLPDQFSTTYGSQETILGSYGLDTAGIVNSVLAFRRDIS